MGTPRRTSPSLLENPCLWVCTGHHTHSLEELTALAITAKQEPRQLQPATSVHLHASASSPALSFGLLVTTSEETPL